MNLGLHPRANVHLAHINQILDRHPVYRQIPETSSTLQDHQPRHHAQPVSSSLSVDSNHAPLLWQAIMSPKRARCPRPRARQVITNQMRAWTAACPQILDISFLHRARFLRAPANPVTSSQRAESRVVCLPIPGTTSPKLRQLNRASVRLDRSRS